MRVSSAGCKNPRHPISSPHEPANCSATKSASTHPDPNAASCRNAPNSDTAASMSSTYPPIAAAASAPRAATMRARAVAGDSAETRRPAIATTAKNAREGANCTTRMSATSMPNACCTHSRPSDASIVATYHATAAPATSRHGGGTGGRRCRERPDSAARAEAGA